MSWFRRRADRDEMTNLRTELESMRDRMAQHAEQTESFKERLGISATQGDVDDRLAAVVRRLETMESRLDSVSTELANQLTELGNDIDALAVRTAGGGYDLGTVEALKQTQTRLAAEQARYQLAFREDLARLVDQLRR